MISTPQPVAVPEVSMEVDNANAEVTDGEWTYDPNEPRYCLCNQVSYGDMVACDNEDVRNFIITSKLLLNSLIFSVLLSGSIILAWESLLLQKANGIVHSVLPQ